MKRQSSDRRCRNRKNFCCRYYVCLPGMRCKLTTKSLPSQSTFYLKGSCRKDLYLAFAPCIFLRHMHTVWRVWPNWKGRGHSALAYS